MRDVAAPAVETSRLSKRYGPVVALDEVNLQLAPGEVFCLLGPNGAGKTTTLNLLLNFTAPTSGTARVHGIDVVREPAAARRHVAYVPEQVALYHNFSGVENLNFFAELSGRRGLDRGTLRTTLARVGLPEAAHDRRLATYSKGMRQKVALAIAVIKRATVLLLDEPLSGLDPVSAADTLRLLRELSDDGATVLMTSHDLFRAHAASTRIGIMHAGRLLHDVAAASISADELEQLYISEAKQIT